MKPIHIIAAIGGVLIVAVGAWYLYMQANPPYEETNVRGIQVGKDKP